MALRVAFRSLVRSWGYSLAVLLTLALGIGTNTTIFCVLNTVLLRPLPFSNPDELVIIWNLYGKTETSQCNVSPPDYFDRKTQATTLQNVAAYHKSEFALVNQGEPEQIIGAKVTASLFATLEATPAMGRSFLQSEDRSDSNPVVILSYGMWQRSFGGDKKILGQTLHLSGKTYTVVGIMPKAFWFPDEETDLWVPLVFTPDQLLDEYRGNEYLTMIGRVRDAATIDQVQAELSTIAARVIQRVPERSEYLLNSGWDAEAVPLRESLFGEVRPTLLLLMCATGFLLLLACANVTNLVMTRNLQRAREVAIRVALGASRTQVASVFLTESILLSVFGGIVGLILSYGSFGFVRVLAPQDVPRITETGLDWRVLAFTIGISLLSGFLFGLTPLRLMSGSDLSNSLKEGSRTSHGRRVQRVRHFLIFTEVAVALILFAGAILFARSFVNLLQQDPGFRTDQRLTFGIALPQSQYSERHQRANFYTELHERIRSTPGVKASGANARLPMSGENWTATFMVEGHVPSAGEPPPGLEYRIITPDYISAMGIPLKLGRDFKTSDAEQSQRVVLIDENLSRRYWPNQNPIGRHISFDSDTPVWREIVGVIGHVRNVSAAQEGLPQVYLPHAQSPDSTMYFVIHADRNPLTVLPAIRQLIRKADNNLPLYRIQTLEQLVSDSVARPRFQVLLLGSFAILALLLAAVGIYGVVSYSVNQRKSEIGVRMALGATQPMILRHVIYTSMVPVVFGSIAGVLGSVALSRVVRGLLFEISSVNVSVLTSASLLIFVTALAAAFLPARRAARTDPAVVLRSE